MLPPPKAFSLASKPAHMLEAEPSGADFLAGKRMTWWLSDRADVHGQSLSLAAQQPGFFFFLGTWH